MAGGAAVTIEHVVKLYGEVAAVNDVSLEVADGEFVTLLGPSGCGKSTLLRMVAGFLEPTRGDVRLHGQSVIGVPPYRRNTSMVFQDYALFPHRTVAENLAFGLRMRKVERGEIARRVAAMLELLGLPGMGDRRISQVSGGQQQRVALGRALIVEPAVLLLDEPLGALDFKLRKQMQTELKHIQRRVGITFLYVTHDQEEALTMSDRVAVMNAGRIEQCAAPDIVYRRPSSSFVADFVGEANLLRARVVAADGVDYRVAAEGGATFPARCYGERGPAVGDAITVIVRPENIAVVAPHDPGARTPATVEEVVFSGASAKVATLLPSGGRLAVSVPAGQPVPARGAAVGLAWSAENAVIVG
ncbi:MAG: ABC transporter ATP-binding protein [Dongiaceae bacterium]